MTAWRIGWLVAPPELAVQVGKLIEYNTSCVPAFLQCAGLAAVQAGESVIQRTVERYRRARDFLIPKLNAIPRVQAATPMGAMHAFFRVDGMTDSLAFCKKLVTEARLSGSRRASRSGRRAVTTARRRTEYCRIKEASSTRDACYALGSGHPARTGINHANSRAMR
jgi:DNA-binding transcriptional MocR family regulator